MLANYFFIDGSALGAQIRVLRKKQPSFQGHLLVATSLISYFSASLRVLGAYEFKRAVFYFPKGDEVAVNELLVLPDFKKPGTVRDIYFKFCGQKLKRSADFTEFVETKVPAKWRDR